MPVHEVSIGQYQPLMLCNEIVVGLLSPQSGFQESSNIMTVDSH